MSSNFTLRNGIIRNILFDLDGTLTDPAEGIINSFLYALEKLGLKDDDPESMHLLIGPSLKDSFCGRYGLPESEAPHAIKVFREYFSARGMYENRVYPGIPSLLEGLVKEGMQLYVATSKMGHFARMIMEHFRLEKYFTAIEGSLPDNTRTAKEEVISHILETYSLKAEECLMVGDRFMDVEGAGMFGIPSIGVSYGYGDREELISAGATALADSPGDLHRLIRNWPAADHPA